jgi:hypothetical protein
MQCSGECEGVAEYFAFLSALAKICNVPTEQVGSYFCNVRNEMLQQNKPTKLFDAFTQQGKGFSFLTRSP